MSCCDELKTLTIFKSFPTRFSGRPLVTMDFQSEQLDLTGFKAYFTLCGVTKEYDDITNPVEVDFTAEETGIFPVGLNYAEIIVEDFNGNKYPFSTAIPCEVKEWQEGDIELDNFDVTITTDIQENTIVIKFENGGGSGTFLHDELIHRDYDNQHPISAITGLEEELRQKEGRAYVALDKIKPYLYNITYANEDYKFAKDYFLTKKPVINIGACSTVRNGNIVGRNYDYTFDKSVEFVIRTPRTAGKYATLGISASVPRLTEEFMESGEYNAESFKLLPFYTVDAINEYGLTASILLVPLDKGQTTGTIPSVEQRDEICNLMLVRYIVDNFQTAQEAVTYLQNYVSVYSPQGLADIGYETHFMVSDNTKSYSLEFVENTLIVTDISTKPYMTNFYLDGVTFKEDGTVYTPADVPTHLPTSLGVTEMGSGLERYNLIVGGYQTANSIASMRVLMNSLKFTNSYKLSTNPQWNTEFVGTWEDFGTFTVDTPASDFTDLKDYIRGLYEQRTRDGKTWQTVHSAVYDLESKTLNLVVQEDGQELEFGFDYYTREEVDKLIDGETEARQQADTALGNRIDTEEQARITGDQTLDGKITIEQQARQDADTALNDRIGDEEDAREQADQTLQENIDQLSEGLSQAIEDESQERADEDSALGARIDNEISNRTTAISNLNTLLETEVTNRTNADNALAQDIREEEERATTAESNLNTAIEAEETDRIAAVQALQLAIDIINGKIPEQATSTNKLADKEFVNSSISTNTANFIGTFDSVEELEAYTGTKTNNDYAFVIGEDSEGNTEYNRYKWTTAETPNKWKYEYTLNNSSFTAVQWAAINSTITATKVGQYDDHIDDTDIHVTTANKTTWNGKQDAISDLVTIRSNAQTGKNASDTIANYGNIVTHNASEFATSTQGAKADTALQPSDIIDNLTSTATNKALSAKQGKVLHDAISQEARDRADGDAYLYGRVISVQEITDNAAYRMSTFPPPSDTFLNYPIQYSGVTNENYTNGYFYKFSGLYNVSEYHVVTGNITLEINPQDGFFIRFKIGTHTLEYRYDDLFGENRWMYGTSSKYTTSFLRTIGIAITGEPQLGDSFSFTVVPQIGERVDVQPTQTLKTINSQSLIGSGNISVATAAQGAKADTALQPSDIIDNTDSTATNKALSANQGRVLYETIDAEAQERSDGYAYLYSKMRTNQQDIASLQASKQDVATALNYNNISNCITHIPQDIKLELNNGTLTLKAGSKVYVPNGAGVFNVITIQNDISAPSTTNGHSFVFVDRSGLYLYFRDETKCVSGTTRSLTTTYMAWYDTESNYVNFYGSDSSTLSAKTSLPIATVTISGGQITAIDQVFNGFGYIGSTVFALPGVKGLIPDGRNEDGSLKNTEVITQEVYTETKNYTNTTRALTINIEDGSTTFGSNTAFIIINDESELTESDAWVRKYILSNNIVKTYDGSGFIIEYKCLVGYLSYDSNGKIITLTPKTAFHAVDYSDLEQKDSNVVHKSGDETISGVKTFNSQLRFSHNPWYNVSSTEKGTIPSSTVNTWFGTSFDSTGLTQAHKLAQIYYEKTTSGDVSLNMSVFNNVSGSTASSVLKIGYNSSGDVYTAAPTPSTSDNSTKIATTAYVNNKKADIVGWGMPDYSRSFTISSSYTTTTNGYFEGVCASSNNYKITIGGVVMVDRGYSNTGVGFPFSIAVPKNTTITFSGIEIPKFIPSKGG